jgi:phosphoribosyl-ATP pyrophosphohydrolase
MTTEQIAILTKAVKHYGIDSQIDKAKEELAELIVALCKGDTDSIQEEMADVEIMLAQLKIMFGDGSDWVSRKIRRLGERMDTRIERERFKARERTMHNY